MAMLQRNFQRSETRLALPWDSQADPISSPSELRAFLQRMPKIDLHRHLEGSLRLQTLAEIAVEHGIDLPSYRTEDLRRYVQVREEEPDYHRFLAKFRLLRRFYRSREALERIAVEVVADAAADNVRYLELRFNPVALSRAPALPAPGCGGMGDGCHRWGSADPSHHGAPDPADRTG